MSQVESQNLVDSPLIPDHVLVEPHLMSWIYRLMVTTGHHCSLSSLHKSSVITSTWVTSLQMFSPILDAFDDRKQVFVQLFQDKMRKPAGGSGDWIPKNAWSGDSSKILGEAISFLSFARTKGWEREGWKHDSCKLRECFESRDTSLPSKDLATIRKEIRSHHNWNLLKLS